MMLVYLQGMKGKRNMKKEELKKAFVEGVQVYKEATQDGKTRKCNNAVKKLEKISELLKENDAYKEVVDELILYPDPSVVCAACGIAFRYEYRTREIAKILKKMSSDDNAGIASLDAYVGYIECKKRGWIK